MPIAKQEAPILTGFIKTQRLASMLTLVEMALSAENPVAADEAAQKQPDSPMANIIKGVRTMSSGDYLEARLDFIRAEKR